MNSVARFVRIIVFLIIAFEGIGQESSTDDFKSNTVYTEFLGSSFYLYNVGYERIVFKDYKSKISIGIGGQFLSNYSNKLSLSPQVSYLHGRYGHLELGAGIIYNAIDVFDRENKLNDRTIYHLIIGYRFQHPKGGFSYGISMTPILNFKVPEYKKSILPWMGISAGWTF